MDPLKTYIVVYAFFFLKRIKLKKKRNKNDLCYDFNIYILCRGFKFNPSEKNIVELFQETFRRIIYSLNRFIIISVFIQYIKNINSP